MPRRPPRFQARAIEIARADNSHKNEWVAKQNGAFPVKFTIHTGADVNSRGPLTGRRHGRLTVHAALFGLTPGSAHGVDLRLPGGVLYGRTLSR